MGITTSAVLPCGGLPKGCLLRSNRLSLRYFEKAEALKSSLREAGGTPVSRHAGVGISLKLNAAADPGGRCPDRRGKGAGLPAGGFEIRALLLAQEVPKKMPK